MRARLFYIALLSLMGLTTTAQAQTSTRPPGYGAELDQPPETLPEPLYKRKDAHVHDEKPPEIDRSPSFTPSAAFGASFSFTDEEIDKPGLMLWLGGTLYPRPSTITPFISAGLKIEAYYEIANYPTDFIPTIRLGGAWLPGSPDSFKNQTFANMEVYALGGYRFSVLDERHGAVRAGIGVSSPAMSPAAAFMCLYGVTIPTQVEVLMDYHLVEQVRDWWIQFGIGF